MSSFITPKGWDGFQHYRDRKPAWIKLHRDLLDNFDYHCLPIASKALAPMLWLLASEHEDGRIPADWRLIAFRLRMTAEEVQSAVTPLISSGFFVASEPLADCKRGACLEKEREREEEREKETETEADVAGATSGKKHADKAARLPEDWSLPDDWSADAVAAGVPPGAVRLEADKFRDYWCAKSGKDATKLDWRATWRNWCRNAADRTYRAKGSKHDLSRMNYTAGAAADGKF